MILIITSIDDQEFCCEQLIIPSRIPKCLYPIFSKVSGLLSICGVAALSHRDLRIAYYS